MTQEQKLIEDISEVIQQKNGVSIFKIQDALRAVLKDVDVMVEECRVKEEKPNILCAECLSDEIKKEKDLYICQNCGNSSEILDGSLQDAVNSINEVICNLSSNDD